MISKEIGKLDYMFCQCGKPPSLVEVHVGAGKKKYRVEAVCCHMQTVLLLRTDAAAYEFGRILATVEMDEKATEALEKAATNIRQIRGRK